MGTNNTGGSAFPRDELRQGSDERVYQQHEGMTLRDYFAAKAMSAVLNGIIARGSAIQPEHILGLAAHAYQIADAMLAERAK